MIIKNALKTHIRGSKMQEKQRNEEKIQTEAMEILVAKRIFCV